MRALTLTLAFLLGLACSMAALRSVAAMNQSESGGRLEHLAQHRKDYDLIVMGPSFTQLHFVPPVFDQRMKELGHPVRSFAFGMPSLRGAELDYYLSRVLALDMPNLRWIVCDVTLNQRRPIEEDNAFKRRVIYWNDAPQFAFMFDVLASAEKPLESARDLLLHARHTLMKVGNVGEGVVALRDGIWSGKSPKKGPRSQFHVSAAAMKQQAKKAERYLKKNKKSHERRVRELLQANAKREKNQGKKPRGNWMMAHWRDEIRAHDASAVFLLSPVLHFAKIKTKVEGGERLDVLDFNDPKRYPELYAPDMHYDTSHLHYDGALVFSRLMAEAFAARLDEQAKGHAR